MDCACYFENSPQPLSPHVAASATHTSRRSLRSRTRSSDSVESDRTSRDRERLIRRSSTAADDGELRRRSGGFDHFDQYRFDRFASRHDDLHRLPPDRPIGHGPRFDLAVTED